MKTRAFVLVIALIVASSLTAAVAAEATVDRSTPSAVVKSFYAWYMKHSWTDQVASLKPYFTSSLYTSLATALRDERCLDEAIIDYDPFNGSQVATTSYSVGTASIHGSAATVSVRLMLALGPGGKPSPGSPVTIALIHGAAGWQINDVITRPNDSLAHFLRGEIAGVQKDIANTSSREHPTAAQLACLKKPIP